MAQDPPGLTSGAALRTVIRNRRAIGLDVRLLSLVAVLAGIAGLGQAALLIVVVRAATALTADTELISGDVGPITATELTIPELLVIGFVVLGILLVTEMSLAYFQARLQQTAQQSSRRRVLAAFARAPYAEQIATSRGDIQTVISGHTQDASMACSLLGLGVIAMVNFVALVGSALVLSPIAGLLVVGGLLVILALLRPILILSRRAADVRTKAKRKMGESLIQRLELTREIRAFGVDQVATEPTLEAVDQVAAATRRVQFLNRTNQALYRLGAFSIVLVMLAVIEGYDATNLAALTGALLILLRSLTYGQAAQKSYQAMNESVPVIEQLVAETERLAGPSSEHTGAIRPKRIGGLSVEDVGFAYPDDDTVLHDISFEVDPGEFVAIVGPSGSGKSTIMALLLRLRDPVDGRILASGVDIMAIDPNWWHRRVAYVPQEPKLQDGTVTEAIRFYRDWITDDDIRKAAAMAHVADEIEAWADGYETNVGQLGDQVSGGQRQRLALARALAGKPELLLLDEPTSALDPTSELLIGQTLEELTGSVTVIAIAHRLKTVEHATRVVHVRDGSLVKHAGDDQRELRRALLG